MFKKDTNDARRQVEAFLAPVKVVKPRPPTAKGVSGIVPLAGTVSKIGTPGFVEIEEYGRIPFTDAKLPQPFEIMARDIAGAKCGDPRKCVVACAWRRNFGKHFVQIVVYRTVLHVIFRKPDGTYESVRYAVSGALRKAVKHYDDSRRKNGVGVWILPLGNYRLEVVAPTQARKGRPNRRHKHGGKGGEAQQPVRVMQSHARRIEGTKGKAA